MRQICTIIMDLIFAGCQAQTIRCDLKGMRYVQKISKDKHVIIQMDTTYWGRGFGLMVIKGALRKKILWRKYVNHETIALYMEESRLAEG